MVFLGIIMGVVFIIWNYFRTRRMSAEAMNPHPQAEPRFSQRDIARQDLKMGLYILLLDVFLIVIAANMFNLDTEQPFWENTFAWFVLLIFPLFAFWKIGKGIWFFLQNRRKK